MDANAEKQLKEAKKERIAPEELRDFMLRKWGEIAALLHLSTPGLQKDSDQSHHSQKFGTNPLKSNSSE